MSCRSSYGHGIGATSDICCLDVVRGRVVLIVLACKVRTISEKRVCHVVVLQRVADSRVQRTT